ncbi:hypothetical protein K2X30_11350 [bacterium]|jgi:hypothetical protein|nr:hypothetical protein [bacterium]
MNDNDTPNSPELTEEDHKVISFQAFKEIRAAEDLDYQAYIAGLSKLELLEEMVRFQEERTKEGKLTLPMMIRGRHLFRALELSAETKELQILTKAYRRHLDYEMATFKRASNGTDGESV